MTEPAETARGLAVRALDRIADGAFANLVLPPMLAASRLDARDRNFATDLVYGTTRMRRACDWLVDRFVLREPDPHVRNLLRLGAYQLAFLGVAPHAAVAATVQEAPPKARGFVNAILRRVAAAVPDPADPSAWPDDATRLSYPDWVVARLTAELGDDDAVAALTAMNAPAAATEREDGYVQDRASQWVAELVGAQPGERIADTCSAPGGKATLMAHAGPAVVVAGDVQPHRARLVAANAARLGTANVATIVADGRHPPHPDATFDRVLVDAPCTGLGVLRRRPDARWRVDEGDVEHLVELQRDLLTAAARLVRPGGTVAYSVCTLTDAETLGIDEWARDRLPDLRALVPPGPPWRQHGRGARLLPHDAGTDGMYVLRMQRAG